MPLFRRPEDVAADLESAAGAATDPWARRSAAVRAARIRSGTALADHAVEGAKLVGRGAKGLLQGAESLLAPAGRPILEGAGAVGRWLYAHPGVATRLGGAMIAAPIIAGDFMPHASAQTNQILNAYADPEYVVTRPDMSKLSEFLEKKAAQSTGVYGDLRNAAVGGFGKGVGIGAADLLGSALGTLFGAAKDALSTNPARKAMIKKLLDSDPVISDAVRRNPATLETLMEAYSTMLRYAPSLTVDTNAVRSFLREVILGGGHVNYATIKNLIETEKALTGAGTRGYGR